MDFLTKFHVLGIGKLVNGHDAILQIALPLRFATIEYDIKALPQPRRQSNFSRSS